MRNQTGPRRRWDRTIRSREAAGYELSESAERLSRKGDLDDLTTGKIIFHATFKTDNMKHASPGPKCRPECQSNTFLGSWEVILVSPAQFEILRFGKMVLFGNCGFRQIGLSENESCMPIIVDDKNSLNILPIRG